MLLEGADAPIVELARCSSDWRVAADGEVRAVMEAGSASVFKAFEADRCFLRASNFSLSSAALAAQAASLEPGPPATAAAAVLGLPLWSFCEVGLDILTASAAISIQVSISV